MPNQQVERRQVVDLPPKRLVITEHQAECKVCPVCQQVTHSAFPQEARVPVQYGPAFGAVAVYLVQQQLLPCERACGVMQDLLGPTMSVGTLQGLVQHCARPTYSIRMKQGCMWLANSCGCISARPST